MALGQPTPLQAQPEPPEQQDSTQQHQAAAPTAVFGPRTIRGAIERGDQGGHWDPTMDRSVSEALGVLTACAGTQDSHHPQAEVIGQRVLDTIHRLAARYVDAMERYGRVEAENRSLRSRVTTQAASDGAPPLPEYPPLDDPWPLAQPEDATPTLGRIIASRWDVWSADPDDDRPLVTAERGPRGGWSLKVGSWATGTGQHLPYATQHINLPDGTTPAVARQYAMDVALAGQRYRTEAQRLTAAQVAFLRRLETPSDDDDD